MFLRVSLAAGVFSLLPLAAGRRMPRDQRMWAAYLIMGLWNNVLPFSLIVREQTQVEGGIASIMNATTSCCTLVLAHFLTRDEKLTMRKFAGVLTGLFGAYVLLRPGLIGGISMRGPDQISGLAASVSLALASIFGKRFGALSPVWTTIDLLTCSSAVLLPVVLWFDRPWALTPEPAAWDAIVGLVLFSTVVAYLLEFSVLRSAGGTNLLLVTLLMPVSAHILGGAFLDESMYATAVAGMLLVVLGLSIMDGRLRKRLRRAAVGAADPNVRDGGGNVR